MNFAEFMEAEESGRMTTVYHASPESNLYILRPRSSKKQDQAGIYVAPTFKDSVKWVVSFVASKKGLFRKKDGQTYHGKRLYYQEITIYELQIPEKLLQGAWHDNFWEEEYFITEDKLDQVKIVSSKTYDYNDLIRLYSRESSIRSEHEMSRYNLDNLAKKLQSTNFAAREYLRLKEAYAQLKLRGGQGDDELVRGRLKKMGDYFRGWGDWNTMVPIQRLNPQQEIAVRKIVSELELHMRSIT